MSKPVITHRLEVGVAEPDVDTSDLSVLWRAFYGSAPPPVPVPTAVREASLTFTRGGRDVFKDRPILIYVDGELWGRLRHEQQLTRAIAPGRHTPRLQYALLTDAGRRRHAGGTGAHALRQRLSESRLAADDVPARDLPARAPRARTRDGVTARER